MEDYGIQNPAIYDCFPKFLRDALLGTGDTMAKTVWKMSGAVAQRFGLQNRGYIRPGCYADLVVLDEEALRNAVPDQEHSFGVEKVFINGKLVLTEDKLDDEVLKTTGRALPCK